MYLYLIKKGCQMQSTTVYTHVSNVSKSLFLFSHSHALTLTHAHSRSHAHSLAPPPPPPPLLSAVVAQFL